jgi:hypothetical protein
MMPHDSRLNLFQSSASPTSSCPVSYIQAQIPPSQHHHLDYSTLAGSDLLLILLGSDHPPSPSSALLASNLRLSASLLASDLRPSASVGDLLVLFKLSINPTVPCPNSLSKYSTLPNPTPCSPLHVPSNSIARWTISWTASLTIASSESVLNRAREWTLPSPTCLDY